MLRVPRSTLLNRSVSSSGGLKGVWVCNNGTGSIVHDITASENNASFFGSPQWVSTTDGWALRLDGSSRLRIDSSSFVFPTENFSVLIRVMPSRTGQTEAIWSAEDGIDNRHSFIYRDASDYFHVSLGDGSNVSDAVFSNSSAQGEFTDIGLAWDKESGLLKGYRDGLEDASTTFDNSLKSLISNPIVIGDSLVNASHSFDGNIAFIYVWDRAVESKEFHQLHFNSRLIFKDSLSYAEISTSVPSDEPPDLSQQMEIDQLNPSTYRILYNDNAEVEFGDINEDFFVPHVKVKRWNKEFLDLKYSSADTSEVQEVKDGNHKTKVVKWKDKNNKNEVHFYSLPATEQMAEGGFELEVSFYKKPQVNTVEFDIEVDGLIFQKQLPYNQQPDHPEDIAAGVVTKTETQGLDGDGKVIVSMPENIINSYSVYKSDFSSFMNESEILKGKAFQIFRPKAVDKHGVEVWCDLDVDTDTKKLTVTVPQAFMDSASFPILVDPTFGYTTLGSTLFDLNNNNYIGFYGNPGANTEVTSLHAGLGSNWDSGDNVKMALYDTSGNLESGSETEELSTGHGSDAFVQFDIASPYATGNQDYVVICQAQTTTSLQRDAGPGGDQSYYVGQTYGAWADPVTFLRSSNIYSTYATYQAASASSYSSFSQSSESLSSSSLSQSSESSLSNSSNSSSSVSAYDGENCWGKPGGIGWDDIPDGFIIGNHANITSSLGRLEFISNGSEAYGYTKVLKTLRPDNFISIVDTEIISSYVIQIRGSASSFAPDAGSPAWENYVVPVNRVWRYVQLRVIVPNV